MEFIDELDLAISLWTQDGVAQSIEKSTPDSLFMLVETLYFITRNQ